MIISVTGNIGIGKTTVCQRVVEIVQSQGYGCGGILTYKASDKSILVEDIQTGEKETLADTNNLNQGPRVGKYTFSTKSIEFGIIEKSLIPFFKSFIFFLSGYLF